jgi:hypothetical protein
LIEYDREDGFKQTARSENSLGLYGDQAVLLVGNAFVDAAARPAGDADATAEPRGDQPEIAIVTPQQAWLMRFQPGSGFEDLTAASNLSRSGGDAAIWVDLDHDGDIDLCVGSLAGVHVWRNNGDGSFVDATAEFGLADAEECRDLAAADFEATNLGVDLVVAGAESRVIYRNQMAGRMAREVLAPARWPTQQRVLADDFNNDGLPDVVFLSSMGSALLITGQEQPQQLELGLGKVDAATTIDIDNDGWLDIAVAGRAEAVPKSVLLRNAGGRFVEPALSLAAPDVLVRRSGFLDADVDNDGLTDLVIIGTDGRPYLLSNKTDTTNRQVKLALRSFAGSPSSIGVRVELRSGEHVVSRWTSRELPIEIGLGQNTLADSIQTLWMNGIARNEIGLELTSAPVRITIVEFIRTSSCPFLYAWVDGAWEFVSDILGTAPLNVAAARGVPLPLDPDEVLVLGPAERFADGAAAARLRVTSELREVIYFDHAKLLAVDHPADTTVFSRDRVAPTGIEGKQIVAGRNPRTLRSAMGSDGIDRTAALAKDDGVFASCGQVLPPPLVGFTEPLSIELDFGEMTNTKNHFLAFTGWFRFGNSSTNIAASQRSDLQVVWPRLEAAGPDGSWQVVEEMVGFPAGNTKTIVCDLTGKLPAGTRRLRLTTSFEVRWDRIALYETVPADTLRVREIGPTIADLQWHGFAELRASANDQPQIPNLARMSDKPGWFAAVEGWCTRYGDIRPLVVEPDPMMAILNSGDGATIEFSARELPAREPGMARTLLLYTKGWIKEADPNTLPDRRVDPLPVEGGDPDVANSSDWQLEYNTRWVPKDIGQAPVVR